MKPTKYAIRLFQDALLKWFMTNKRTFLWRTENASNYERIISEVLLQRTKAETVEKYFKGFLAKYPSWSDLGNASEQQLVEILKPLGLSKQRGARLYKLAQDLKNRNGEFPQIRSEIEEMSMMGQYITNAFELFVLNKNTPLLDVNMARLLERYFGPRKLADIRYDPYLQNLAKEVVNHQNAKELNWAILDYAALICKARKPLCESCTLSKKCTYFKTVHN